MGFKTMAYFKVSLNRDTKASGVAGGVRPPDENARDPWVVGEKDTLPLCRFKGVSGGRRCARWRLMSLDNHKLVATAGLSNPRECEGRLDSQACST